MANEWDFERLENAIGNDVNEYILNIKDLSI